MKIIRYNDLHYTTVFNAKNGFFARIEDNGFAEPFWAPHGPELIDIAITNWCDRGCNFCYRKSSVAGTHMSFINYCDIIDVAKSSNVFQVALGGGNPNQHPQFVEILEYTHKAGIVPNYTTNGRGLTAEVLTASTKFCGAVAVSAYQPYIEMQTALEELQAKNIKTNVHFLLGSHSINEAIDWLQHPPQFLQGVNAVIFLSYKPIGRKVYEEKLLSNSSHLSEFYTLATSGNFPFKVGFDACSVSALFGRTDYNTVQIEAGDAGRFSMFISEDMKVYPCSFHKDIIDGDTISDSGDFLEIWRNSENFNKVRTFFKSDYCGDCEHKKFCFNGCPLFDDIRICGIRE